MRPQGPRVSRAAVSAVVTSCDRHDLLERTLDSFLAHNTYPLERMIVVEDGEHVAERLRKKYEARLIEWVSTGKRVGQIAAVDYAYSRLETPYIFHMEDDWEFYREGFIEGSLAILRRHQHCLQVWIRSVHDTSGHPLEPRILRVGEVRWKKLELDYEGMWHGFSFNPGLRRLADYIAIGGYGGCAAYDFHRANRAEAEIGRIYRNKGYFAAILMDPKGEGYVRHIGDGHHVGLPPSRPAASVGESRGES
jgi:Glycosyl transferase family 2